MSREDLSHTLREAGTSPKNPAHHHHGRWEVAQSADTEVRSDQDMC